MSVKPLPQQNHLLAALSPEVQDRLFPYLELVSRPLRGLTLTQDFIGNMLGVRRETVTRAASKLRELGVISYARGLITVLDRSKLETLSCECYEVVHRETELLLDYLPQHQTVKKTESMPLVTLQTTQGPEAS